MKHVLSIVILIAICLTFQLVSALPWWAFVVPCSIAGVVLPFKKWNVSAFIVGFVSGFVVWVGTSLYYASIFEGNVRGISAELIGSSEVMMLLGSGAIGGVITALAVYFGSVFVKREEIATLTFNRLSD